MPGVAARIEPPVVVFRSEPDGMLAIANDVVVAFVRVVDADTLSVPALESKVNVPPG